MKRLALMLACCLAIAQAALAGQDTIAPDAYHRLTVYTSHKEEVYVPIIREFEERTGIWVDAVYGGTNSLLERIAGESQSPKADVIFGGGVESLQSYSEYFETYTACDADRINAMYASPDGAWTPFSALPIVLIYNTKLVAEGELTGWCDLLSEKYRGRIAFADPSVSASCFTALVTMLDAVGGDREEALQKFATNLENRVLPGSGDVLTSVASGTDLIGVTLEETALKHIEGREDIALVYPADGTSSVPDGSAVIKGARSPENARLFLDFTVSEDVQRILGERFYRRSVRTDVARDEALPALDRIPLVDYDVKGASDNREAILMAWAFFLGRGEGQ